MPLGRAPIRRPGTALGIVTTLVSVLVAVLATGGVAVAVPAYTLDERAAAIASPSLVYLEANVEGYLRARGTGAVVEPKSLVISRTCSGFAVGADGYVVTVAHCVVLSKDSLRGSAAVLVANDMIKNNKLPAAQKDAYVRQLTATTDFTGATAGSPPVTTVYGQLFDASGGLTASPAVSGKVVDSRPDVALVKLSKTGLPVVKVDNTEPGFGAHVVQIAFGTDNTSTRPVAYTVRSRPSSVLGEYGTRTPPVYKMDGDLGAVAAGGIVVNSSGHVVGVIDGDTASANRSDELIADTSVINDLIAKAGVKNDQTASDQAYLAGLDNYYGGQYSQAIKKFDSVLAAQPDNKLAQNFQKQAQQRLAIEGDKGGPGPPRWLPVALAGLGGVLIALLVIVVVILMRRRRRRRAEQDLYGPDPFARNPYAPDPFAPISAAPVSAAPVSAAPVSAAPVSAAPVSTAPGSVYPVSGGGYPSRQQPTNPAPTPGPFAPPPGPFAPPPGPFAPPPGPFAPPPGPVSSPPGPVSSPPGPVSASPVPTSGAGSPSDSAHPAPPVPPTQYQAGVPAPVSPPPGIPVRHPTWSAAAPIQLPEQAAAPQVTQQEPGTPARQEPGPDGSWTTPAQREKPES